MRAPSSWCCDMEAPNPPSPPGSAHGDVLCAVHCYLYAVLSCAVPGESNPCVALHAPGVSWKTASPRCVCTPPKQLPTPYRPARWTAQSNRSTSQFVRWIRTSTSRISRASASACPRSSATGSAEKHHQLGPKLPTVSPLALTRCRVRRRSDHRVTQPQDIPAREGISERPIRFQLHGGIGPIDPPDQRFQSIQHRTGLSQELGRVLGGSLPFLVSRAADDARSQLFHTPRRLRTFCQCLSKLHCPHLPLHVLARVYECGSAHAHLDSARDGHRGPRIRSPVLTVSTCRHLHWAASGTVREPLHERREQAVWDRAVSRAGMRSGDGQPPRLPRTPRR